MTRYCVVSAVSSDSGTDPKSLLQDLVQEKFLDGWVCQGGISALSVSRFSGVVVELMQAMVKEVLS